MKILITGATGFIGTHLVKQLLNEKQTIFCTLLKGETNPFGEDSVKSFVLTDLSFNEIVEFLLNNNIEGIIHLASFVQSGEHKPSEIGTLIDTNIKFSTTLLEAATLANVKWFINTGTFWQFYRNNEYCPVNLYAATKQAFMDIAKYYWDSGKIKFCSIILYDTYGPNDPRPKIFNLWEKIAKTGETLNMSPGHQLIDISHIEDIISAFIVLAFHLHNNNTKVNNGDTFAVMAKKRYSLKELSFQFEKITNKKLNINWAGIPYKNREIFRPCQHLRLVPNWCPKITIKKGLKIYCNPIDQ